MNELFPILFDILKIDYTKKWLDATVADTPFINTMFGVGNILSLYKVSHQCVRLDDKDKVANIDMPSLMVYDGSFAVIISADSNEVLMISDGIRKSVSLTEFTSKWDGVIMLVSADSSSGEPDYKEHLRDERIANFKKISLVAAGGAVLAAGTVLNPFNGNLFWWLLVAVDVVGVYVSVMLLQKELHIPNRMADKLCGLVKESHCENVTQSSGASFFGIAKLSEIGFGFFSANLLAAVFFPKTLFFLSIFALIVLPFTFWSVWYQKFKAKSWCVLCLSTCLLMWLQAAICLSAHAFVTYQEGLAYGVVLAAGYVAATLSANALVALMAENRENERWKSMYNSLKASDKVVGAFENDAPVFNTNPQDCTSLIFGNPDAPYQITVFSNPYCGPCAMMHSRIKNLPGEDVGIRYVMTYFTKQSSKINRFIIAAYRQLGAERTWRLLSEWYDGGKSQGTDFFTGYGLDISDGWVESEFLRHEKWRKDERLTGTPTVLVNGRMVMYPYSVEDYLYMPA